MTGDGGGAEGERSTERPAPRSSPDRASAKTTRPARPHASAGRVGSLLVALLAVSSVIAGCAAPAARKPAPQLAAPDAPTRPPPDGPRMHIVDLEEYATEAAGWVVVMGTLENGGRSTTEELRITVNGLGQGDRVVTSSPAIARSQHVAPRGRTTFAAVFAKDVSVEAYHVKVLAW